MVEVEEGIYENVRGFFVEVKVFLVKLALNRTTCIHVIVQKTFVLVKVFLVKLPLQRTCNHVIVQKTFVLVEVKVVFFYKILSNLPLPIVGNGPESIQVLIAGTKFKLFIKFVSKTPRSVFFPSNLFTDKHEPT